MTTPTDIFSNYKTALVIFDITVVILVIVIALILGVFVVLSNLLNIYVSGKKKEVIVMRINGFSKNGQSGIWLVR